MIIKSGIMCTESAITFFLEKKHLLGPIVRVEMKEYCDGKDFEKHPLHLIDEENNEMWVSGVSSGYVGEGPHGTFTILMEGCKNLLSLHGITPEQLKTLISKSPFFTIK